MSELSDKILASMKCANIQLDNAELFLELDEDLNFERNLMFTVNGTQYRIEYWHNLSYLFIKGLCVMFDDVAFTNTWPHYEYQNELMFTHNGINTAVLGVDKRKQEG